MLIAIFYDRKNRREIGSDKLVFINLVESVAVGDNDDERVPTGRRLCPHSREAMDQATFDRAKADGHFNHSIFKGVEQIFSDWEEELMPRVLHLRDRQISSIGYKSENCPKYQNWDLHCNEHDLVFVRFEDVSI